MLATSSQSREASHHRVAQQRFQLANGDILAPRLVREIGPKPTTRSP